MELVRTLLTPETITPGNIRYDETCDCIQVSPDGGTTWNDAPGLDPRHNDAGRSPALTGSSIQCDAAANMVAKVTAYVAIITGATNALSMAGGLLAFLAFLPLVGWLFGLIVSIASALIGIGSTAITNAFSQEVYDQLLCIFYDNIGADGQMSAEQLTAIQDAIYADIGGVAFTVCSYFFSLTGEVGMSNAGATGTETGDCEACAPGWRWQWDFAVDDGGFAYYSESGGGGGTWVEGEGWVCTSYLGANVWRTTNYLDFTLPAGSAITRWTLNTNVPVGNTYVKQCLVTHTNYAARYGLETYASMGSYNYIFQDGLYETEGETTLFFTLDVGETNLHWITVLTLDGTGDCPDFPSGYAA
jgi:hypothetical protein